jgi:hypothetical protein
MRSSRAKALKVRIDQLSAVLSLLSQMEGLQRKMPNRLPYRLDAAIHVLYWAISSAHGFVYDEHSRLTTEWRNYQAHLDHPKPRAITTTRVSSTPSPPRG